MADACPRWACVYTHPQAERWADANLRRLGYTTWLPLVLVRRRDRALRTMWHSVELPAFPRYLFVQHHPGSPVSPLWYAPGVARLLGKSAENVEYAPGEAIEALQAALAPDRTPMAREPDWAPGTPCRLVEGPLRGTEAVVLGKRGYFVRLSLVMGEGLATVQVTSNYIAPRDDA